MKGSPKNLYTYNGKEEQEETDWLDFDTRMYDAALGRFNGIDLLSESYPFQSPYVYAVNNPVRYVDFLGMGPADPDDTPDKLNIHNWLFGGQEEEDDNDGSSVTITPIQNPQNNANDFSAGMQTGVAEGMAGSNLINSSTVILVDATNGVIVIADASQIEIGSDGSITINATTSAFQSGKDVGNLFGNALFGLSFLDAGLGAAGGASKPMIANQVPSKLARVVENFYGQLPPFGRAGASDVFVTAADDIAGLNAQQIAQRLTIPESSTGFKVINFKTPSSGIASPVNRSNAGFVGGGRTAGGAREFVIPNQAIPQGAKIIIVK